MQILYPTWYDENRAIDYPFESGSPRSSGTATIDNDIFVDGRIFAMNGASDVFISNIVIDPGLATISLSTTKGVFAVGQLTADHNVVVFKDAALVPVGTLVGLPSDASPDMGVNKLLAWPVGTYTFTSEQTRLAASVVVPQPQACVRRFVLDSGVVFTGDVCMVGERGVQLTHDGVDNDIRIDVVGDPMVITTDCAGIEYVNKMPHAISGLMVNGLPVYPNANNGGITIMAAETDPAHRSALRVKSEFNGIRLGFAE